MEHMGGSFDQAMRDVVERARDAGVLIPTSCEKYLGPPPAPRCPGCGLVMSNREASEQGACNECRPGGAWSPDEGA